MSERYPGGIITKSPATPTGPLETGAAPGIWTLEQQMQFKQQGVWPLAGNVANYIEEVFSCFLYTGTGAALTITNGIDLSNKGGLVWTKKRNTTNSHILIDTARGADYGIYSDLDYVEDAGYSPDYFGPFNSTGYGLSLNAVSNQLNQSAGTYVSWTFREQAKFFDIVTYTGTGSNTTIAHNLGAVPGCIIVKRRDTSGDWQVYHRSLANTQYLVLNSTAAVATGATRWNSTTPTSSVFSLGTNAAVNASGGTYVAYLFAHDAGGFGLAGTDNVISCGSYTGTGAAGNNISLGYEPQWLLIKNSAGTYASVNSWTLYDVMRGFDNSADNILRANTSGAEIADTAHVVPTSTGFTLTTSGSNTNGSGSTYIYIAIRRGPMKVPTLGTSVFALGGTASSTLTTSFAVDAFIQNSLTSSAANSRFCSRLQGSDLRLVTSSTDAEAADNGDSQFSGASYTVVGAGSGIVFGFGRAPSFFDEVCYTGGSSPPNTFAHNLGVAPELMIIKSRNNAYSWFVYSQAVGVAPHLRLNTTDAATTGTAYLSAAPDASNFYLNGTALCNSTGDTYVAYLFATCAGVSKVGSYTGTGTTLQVNCGFTAGARFVLIKRTDSTGDWYVWDSARGIVAGNDPYLLLNTTAAQVTGTDYVDTYNAGFEISSTAPSAINASAGTFIFLAIA